MSTTNILPTAVLATIASLRIRATPWNKVAEAVSVPEADLPKLLHVQRDEFQREMAIAKHDLLEEMYLESLAKLQQTMNCGDLKAEASAAKALLRTCEVHMRLEQKANKETPKNNEQQNTRAETSNRDLRTGGDVSPPASKPVEMIAPPPATTEQMTATRVTEPVLEPVKAPVKPTATANPPKKEPSPDTITPKTFHQRTFTKTLRDLFSSG